MGTSIFSVPSLEGGKVIPQILAVFGGCLVIACVLTVGDSLAERVGQHWVRKREVSNEPWYVFALSRFLVVDCVIALFVVGLAGLSALTFLTLVPVFVGRLLMGVGHQSHHPSQILIGRIVSLVPLAIAFLIPAVGAIARSIL